METSFSSTGPVSHPDAPQESDHSALPQSADTQLYPAVKTSESIFTPHGTEQGSRKSPHDENQLDEKRTINGLPSESHITANGSCHKSNDKQSPTSASHSESTVTVSGSSNSDEPKNIPNGSYPKVNGATDGSNISPTGESKVTPNGCAVIPNGIRSSIKLDSAPLIATNGTSILSNSSDISSRQSGCDNAKTASSNPTPARKSSLTLSLARRGSGFTNPMGQDNLQRGPSRKKSSDHHVQFEPPTSATSPISEETVAGSSSSTHRGENSKEPSTPCGLSSSSSSSESDSTLDNISQLHAPDGGWGWVIVFASFMVNVIADGITFSFGVIYIEFLHYFGEGKSRTAWIGSLFMATPLLSGPIASFLTDRYGCRNVTILGGILASSGFILSSFANSINVLLVTFGLIAGFGLSLCYVAAVVIVAYYFDDHRSFATGLSVCGSGIGTFLFAPLNHYLLNLYGWRGTTLILAGLFLNLCVCGALMRDLAWTRAKAKAQRRQFKKARRSRLFSGEDDASCSQHSTVQSAHASVPYPSIDELRKLLQQPGYMVTSDEKTLPRELGMSSPTSPYTPNTRLCSSLVNLPTFVRSGEKVPLEVLEALTHQHHVYSVLVNNYPSLLISSRSFSQSGRLNEQPFNGTGFCNCPLPSPICSPKSQSHPTSPLAKTSFPPPLPITPQLRCKNTHEDNVGEDDLSPMLPQQNGEKSPVITPLPTYDMLEAKLSPTCANGGLVHPQGGSTNSQGGLANPQTTVPQFLLSKRVHTHQHSHSQRRLPTAYLKDLRVHRHSLTYRGAMLNINRYRLRASSCPDIYRNSMTTIAKEKAEWYAGLWELWYLLSDMLDFSHFKNAKYTLFAISNFLLYFWYDVPYVYLADNAVEAHGISEEDASYLISMIGILNMFGEIVLGWAGDREWVNGNMVYALCMALCGGALALIPLIKDYQYMCGVSGFFGLFVAANYSLTSIILVEITTIERFTNAYGLLLLVQGVANLVGPPLAGWLYDLTNSYDLAFYLSGLFIAVSGILLVLPTSCKEPPPTSDDKAVLPPSQNV